jgi:hypothetical protein
MAIYLLNRVKDEQQITIAGLPRGATLKSQIWNPDGSGALKDGDAIRVDQKGVATVKVPHMAIIALTQQ